MAYNFYECNRNQIFLLPPSMKEWLPARHLVWFLLDALEQMDLSGFYQKYRVDGKGQRAYEPSMMVGLLLYAYCMGVRSSRKIESLCEVDIAFRVISANEKPDHTTLARFRKGHRKALEGLFLEVLKLCAKTGVMKVGVVALDGTKVKANASLEKNRTYEHLKEEIRKMMEEAEQVDREEDERYGVDRRGDELPEGLEDRRKRLERLKECKRQLEEEARQEAQARQEKHPPREEEEAKRAPKKRGRKPKKASFEPKPEAKVNMTDPESRIMKTRSGYIQGYNAQVVATEGQYILAADVTSEANDVHQSQPMLEQARKNLKAVGVEEPMETALLDAGYWDKQQLMFLICSGLKLLVAPSKEWKLKASLEQPAEEVKEPSLQASMRRKLSQEEHYSLYRKRKVIVEPVFGQLKVRQGFDRLVQRGKSAGRSEFRFACAAHNLLKLYRRTKALRN